MTAAHRPTIARMLVAAAALACLAALRLLLGSAPPALVLDAVLAIAAAGALLEAGRRARPGRSRAGWRYQSAAAVCWLLAPAAWLSGAPEAVATAGRLGFVLCAAAGWWLTSHSADTRSRIRLVVDSWLAAASLFVAGWLPALRPIWVDSGGGVPGALAVGLPLAAVAVAVLAFGLTMTEIRRDRRLMPFLSITGLLTVAVSDLRADLGATPVWSVGFACFVLATRVYSGTSLRQEVISTRPDVVRAPYLLLAPAAITLAVQHLRGGIPAPEAAAAVLMTALLLVRQHVTLQENHVLVQRLAASQGQLRHQATHDALTGMAGRVVLYERLEAATEARRTGPVALAVVFVDLDDFKEVNDTLGHAAGDDVLVQVARRLTDVLLPLGDGATAVRMGGDEFAALLVGDAAEQAAATAAELLDVLRRPMTVNGRQVGVGASIGVAVADGDVGPSALLRAADVAMYGVKHQGKGGVGLADPQVGAPSP